MNLLAKVRWQAVIPLIALLIAALSACGDDKPADTATPTASPALASSTATQPPASAADFDCAAEYRGTEPDASTFPVEVTDDAKKTLLVAAPPSAIVSLSAAHTEILYAIGAGDQVVAGDKFSDCPAAAQKLEHLDSFEPNVEAIVALEPDLVIMSYDPGTVRASLEGADVPVFFVNAPASVQGVYAQIEQVGRVTGHLNEAGALTLGMQLRIDEVVEVARTVENRPSVFHEVDTSYYSAGPGSFVGDLYDILRVPNIANATGEAFPLMTEEAIIAGNPGVIILADEDAGESPETVKARAGWDAIAAVKTNRIYTINPDIISRPGPRLVEAIETLAKFLYPDEFP